MTCQNKGYNLITIERGTEDENEACFYPIILACVLFHYHSNPIEKFSIAY